ncbi:TPA: dUTPase [Staphylococcus aureus]|uniref:dUTPase n=1 Tax=Staphylococcus aureus TaxID=1280 RepID=UPI0004962234|nr:dUTPase [Staphylococcus aureus]MDI1654345.1 dUTP diphosphatase [Staphylococcus aureus]MDL9957850.1 dUTP diphosphatase [Staphylococcus aureus]GBW55830.1 dUTPase [Staphylococcus aureus]GBZ69219.1 dUTPase [Staphylococcus aureus]HCJ4442779.1 dUTPase [Staphylococcus aureus]
MTDTLTTDQLQELLQIQKEFDDRIPTLNLGDSKIAYVVEFFEWFNTLETFKNWKKKPGKPLDVQLDELADMLAFGLSIANQSKIDEFLKGYILYSISISEKVYGDFDFTKENVIKSVIIDIPEELFENSDASKILAPSLPFVLAKNYYSINQLIDAYKKKMKRNHERQDGTADAGKGYV